MKLTRTLALLLLPLMFTACARQLADGSYTFAAPHESSVAAPHAAMMHHKKHHHAVKKAMKKAAAPAAAPTAADKK